MLTYSSSCCYYCLPSFKDYLKNFSNFLSSFCVILWQVKHSYIYDHHSKIMPERGVKERERKNWRQARRKVWKSWGQVCSNVLGIIHTVGFDWFLSGLEWILNFWHFTRNYYRISDLNRLNFSTFWVFEPVFFVQRASILIKHI